ncbi:unnamed protein product [Blepharisma stoltei]|uniref:Importin subunit alpha n=1 Tax=Blepharisma stoltei TaxID=1481888 RepID=A0AAU9IU69_9CILI|nr:unnamed protein product [Blepharisma stoltei]
MSEFEARFSERKQHFLESASNEDLMKRHNEYTIELRRKKRNQHLAKRRALISGSTNNLDFDGDEILVFGEISEELLAYCPDLNNENLDDLSKLAIIKKAIDSDPPQDILLHAIWTVRNIISMKHGPPIGAFLNLGYGETLIKLLSYDYGLRIPLEASWALCNLVSGPHEYVESLVRSDIIPALLKLTCPECPSVAEHTLWALSNISGDCHEYRQVLINSSYIELLQEMITRTRNISNVLIKVISWCVSNLSRGSDYIPYEKLQRIIDIINQLIVIDDHDIHSECLWALAYISKNENEKVQMVLDSGYITFIIDGLKANSESIVSACVRLVCNISSGTDSQTQKILDENILDLLQNLMQSDNDLMVKEIYMAISNFAGGSISQVKILADHPIFKLSFQGLIHRSQEVRIEASHIFKNFCLVGRNEKLQLKLIELNFHEILQRCFEESDATFLLNILSVCRLLLEAGNDESENKITKLFEEAGIAEEIEKLDKNMNSKIYSESTQIIETYFLSSGIEPDISTMKVESFKII